MTVPTKAQTKAFIDANKSFFTTPLTGEGQNDFQAFYEQKEAIDQIVDYSHQLQEVLYKHHQILSERQLVNGHMETTQKAVIYAWRNGNFAPALEHEAVRQFIMDNKDHPAIVLWRNNELKIQKPEEIAPLPIPDSSKAQDDFTIQLLSLNKSDFDKLFAPGANVTTSENIVMTCMLVDRGGHGGLFKSQEEYNIWRDVLISTKERLEKDRLERQNPIQGQNQKPIERQSQNPVENRDITFFGQSSPTPEAPKGLLERFLEAIKQMWEAIVTFLTTCSCDNQTEGPRI